MDVPRHELGKGVGDSNDGLGEVFILHPCGAPQRAGTGHVAAMCSSARTIYWHRLNLACVKPL